MSTGNKIYVGIAGWSYKDWEGIVYPSSSIDKLQYVSQYTDCIEINSTFYRPPEQKNSASWHRRTQNRENFFFTAKLHRNITHEGKLEKSMIKQFKHGFEPLLKEDKLKNILIQFRYDFAASDHNKQYFKKIIESLRDTFELITEVHHISWQSEENLKFLKDLNVTVCNLDYPVAKNSFNRPYINIGKTGYIRLHGRNYKTWFDKDSGRDETYNYYYPQDELKGILEIARKLVHEFKTYTIITNNHYKGAALANALELKHLLTNSNLDIPDMLIKKYPRLKKVAKNIQQDLF